MIQRIDPVLFIIRVSFPLSSFTCLSLFVGVIFSHENLCHFQIGSIEVVICSIAFFSVLEDQVLLDNIPQLFEFFRLGNLASTYQY